MEKSINKLSIIIPVFLSFFVMGFVDVVGIATSYVKQDFELSDSLANLLPMMVFMWFAFLSLPVGLLQNKYGKKKVLNFGIALTFLAMLLPFAFYTFPIVLISFVLIGVGNTVIQVAANPLLHDISKKENFSSNMSLSQFIKAIASLIGPIMATWFALSLGNWRYIFVMYFLIALINFIWLRSVNIEEQKSDVKASFSDSLSLLKDKRVLMLSIAILAIVGIDVGINTNIISVLQSKFNMSIEDASTGIKVYFLSLMASRVIATFILRKVDSIKFLISNLVLGLLSFIALYLVNNSSVSFFLIFGIGFFTANVFPIIFSKAIELMPSRSNEISGLMIMSVCGGAVFPFLMGLVSDSFGAVNSLLVLILCTAYIMFTGLYFLESKKTI